jgi:signal transduction histidine kinase
MGDGVAMFDETPRLVAWNRKFQDILDLPDGVLAERLTFAEYIRYLAKRGEYGSGADSEEQVRRLVEQVGQYRTYERTRPNGRVIEIRHNPVPDGGFVLIYADITERKRNEAEIRAARDAAEEASKTIEAAYRDLKAAQANLIQAEKMASLGQLTAGIAHEIKNPLNFVNNFAELSVDLLGELKNAITPVEATLTPDQRGEVDDVVTTLTSNLEKITEHGKRADGIVRAMLEHSRGSSAERRMADLNALIDEALKLAYHGARAQDQSFYISLERDFCESITPIQVNPQDMTRVFLNLIGNGFYATTKRARDSADAGFVPTLKVSTRDTGDAVEIRVWDNGTGIPADIRDKLFQPFFTTKPTGEGTGLGLSITYDIVTQQHGGSLIVDNKLGEYSEFTIRLPRYA